MSLDDFKPKSNSRYFKAEDLPADGSVLRLELAGIAWEQINEEDEDEKSVISFVDERKCVVLNQSRFDQLTEALGDISSVDDLKGKMIGLKRGSTRFKGKKVDCVQIVPIHEDPF